MLTKNSLIILMISTDVGTYKKKKIIIIEAATAHLKKIEFKIQLLFILLNIGFYWFNIFLFVFVNR